jgi:alditol oxidase
MGIRTVAADDLWLSPAYRRDSLCIGFTWRRHPAQVTVLMHDVEAALAPFHPPALGKAAPDLQRRPRAAVPAPAGRARPGAPA